jgi:hypothetical protein
MDNMYILQIHFGELNDERKACIESVKQYYSDCNYIFIDDPEPYVLKIMDHFNIKQRPRRFDVNNLKGKVVLSDWIRFWICANNPDLLYLDTDVIVNKRFEFTENGKPYMLEMTYPAHDYCVIYSNNCKNFFIDEMQKRINHSAINVMMGPWCLQNTYMIPKEYMTHISTNSKVEEHWQINNSNW